MCDTRVNVYRLPFDWKNPVGYLIAVAFQCALIVSPLRYITCMMSIGFAIYVVTAAISRATITDLQSINESINAPRREPDQQSLCADMFKRLIKFIVIHSDAKQFSKLCECACVAVTSTFSRPFRTIFEFSHLYEAIFASLFVGSIIEIGISMLMIQMEIVEYKLFVFSSLNSPLHLQS